jgi:nucleotide-binding universal stress UspA family protein
MKNKRNKVLIPVDRSAFSLQVLPSIMHLLQPAMTEVILLRVAPLPSLVMAGEDGDPELTVYPDQQAASLEADFHTELLPSLARLEQAGFQVSTTMRFGDPAYEIERYLEEDEVDLVAMTTHGRTGIDHMLFGSVAEHVVQHAHVPVLLFRSLGNVTVQEEEFSPATSVPALT